MACYEYRCKDCELVFESNHGMTENPVIICPRCESNSTSKVPQLVGMSVRREKSLAMGRAVDQVKKNIEMKNELRRDLGIEKINPVGRSTMSEIYHDAKIQQSFIKERMAEQAEKRAAETKAKQKEWMKAALKRTPQRGKEKRERLQAEAAKKRAIRI